MSPRLRTTVICLFCAVLGLGLGLTIRADGLFGIFANALGQHADDEADVKQAAAGPDGDVHLTVSARRSLGLKTAIVRPKLFTRRIRLPGLVVEKPGHSGRTVASRVRGIVSAVYCTRGQLVRPGDPLFRVQLSGDALITAQVALLETTQQIVTTQIELDRITKLVARGTVPARERIQLEYSMKQLESSRDLRRKELLVRGLTTEQIDLVVDARELIDAILISVPGDASTPPATASPVVRAGTPAPGPLNRDQTIKVVHVDAASDNKSFTVEEINVHPGQSIGPGDRLADLAWHDRLSVVGHAFERDVAAVAAMSDRGWSTAIEYGAHDEIKELADLPIQFMDNHVDEHTGTFRFYVDVRNTVLQDRAGPDGIMFRVWQFKPGQRVHVTIPVEELTGQFVLPREAVAQIGPDAFVFRYAGGGHGHAHGDDEPDDQAHEDEDIFRAVPVSIVHRDSQQVVVASDGKLLPGTKIAVNNAYQLYIASKSGAGGGGGHAHPHPH